MKQFVITEKDSVAQNKTSKLFAKECDKKHVFITVNYFAFEN